jgi:hypothetical protein
MSLKHTHLLFALAFGALGASAAQADQLCHADGTGCMNISWACGSFTTPSDMMCISTLAAKNPAIKELGQTASSAGGYDKDVAEMRKRKAKQQIILPDPSVAKKALKATPSTGAVVQ